MTEREKAFVDRYMIHLDASRAYREAYNSKAKGAGQSAHRVLQRPHVQAAIKRRARARARRLELSADRVLLEAMRVAYSNLPATAFDEDGHLLPPHQMPEDAQAAIAGLELEQVRCSKDGSTTTQVKKVKAWDKLKALELLMKHLGLLVERVEINDLSERIARAREHRAPAGAAARSAATPAKGSNGNGETNGKRRPVVRRKRK